jgi:CheY-like chemotaxis protein
MSDPSTTSRRVLVVEDNPDAAESLAMLIRLHGHEARIARDGPEALSLVEAYRPDVALVDIGLPGIDGYEVARRLRARPELLGVVLVALTGYSGPEERLRSHEAGFDRHMVKPVDIVELERLLGGVAQG